jgi:hypothetical protein
MFRQSTYISLDVHSSSLQKLCLLSVWPCIRDRPKEAQARDGLISRKGKQLSVSEGGGFHIKGVSNSNAGENRGKHHEEDHGEEHHEEHHLSSRSR